jgi:peptidoglycan/xylan/chitin deacetylase (PgdA/CDA1 family)
MRLPILMYHNVDRMPDGVRHPRNYVAPDLFRAQLEALKRWGYETISFETWIAYRAGERSLPARPIILTFDDGYRTALDVAWPIMAPYGFRGTVFVVSDLLGGTNRWDRDDVQVPLLDAREVGALRALGMEIGSHGRSHGTFRGMRETELEAELRESRATLEGVAGGPVRALCYPYGQQDARVRALARRAGYEAGVVWARRLNRRTTDPMRLARLWIDSGTSVLKLWGMLAGLRLLP